VTMGNFLWPGTCDKNDLDNNDIFSNKVSDKSPGIKEFVAPTGTSTHEDSEKDDTQDSSEEDIELSVKLVFFFNLSDELQNQFLSHMKSQNVEVEVVNELEQCQFFVFVAVTSRITEIVNVDFGSAIPIMLRRLSSNDNIESPWKELIELKYSHVENWEDCIEFNRKTIEDIMKFSGTKRKTLKKNFQEKKIGGLKIYFNKNAEDIQGTLLQMLDQNEIACERVQELKDANFYCVVCVVPRVREIIGDTDFEEILANKLGIVSLQREGKSNLPIEKPDGVEKEFLVIRYSDTEYWVDCDNEKALSILKTTSISNL